MTHLPRWAMPLPLALGGSGLFLVAFLDASFFSLPEINDILVVAAVIKHPPLLWYYALMATAGSVLGTWVLFLLAKKGGTGFIEKRVHGRHLARIRNAFSRYGAVSVFIASILPPPTPFKLFVLVAAVSGMRTASLVTAVTAGRAVRYVGAGLLALWLGERAVEFVQRNGPRTGLYLAVGTAATVLVWRLCRAWSNRLRRPAESGEGVR